MSPLWVIINQTLNTGINPDKLKIAKVIALCTKDNKSKTDNYRPISLLDLNLENIREIYNQVHQWPLLLTWFNFNPSMDK